MDTVNGTITNGEAKVLAAMACETDPENVESFLVLTFNHRAVGHHELIMAGDVTVDPIMVAQMLSVCAMAIDLLGNPVSLLLQRSDYERKTRPEMEAKIIRFCHHIRRSRLPFRK